VDWTSRLCRAGKAKITDELDGIMARLGTSAEYWQSHLQTLFSKPRWVGNYCATSAERLRAIAVRRGVHHVGNTLGAFAAG
jgi:hypothetical protein